VSSQPYSPGDERPEDRIAEGLLRAREAVASGRLDSSPSPEAWPEEDLVTVWVAGRRGNEVLIHSEWIEHIS
jgi:hypothetical protein